ILNKRRVHRRIVPPRSPITAARGPGVDDERLAAASHDQTGVRKYLEIHRVLNCATIRQSGENFSDSSVRRRCPRREPCAASQSVALCRWCRPAAIAPIVYLIML